MGITVGLRRVGADEYEVLFNLTMGEELPEWGTFPRGDNDVTDVDKAWDGLNYLLTKGQSATSLGFLLEGGKLISADEGNAERLFSPSEVAVIAEELARLSPDELRGRFDPVDMMRAAIYPEIWHRDPQEDDTLDYLLSHYAELRRFTIETAARRQALVVDIG